MIYIRINELLKEQKKSKYWFIKHMEGGYQALSKIMNNETNSIHFSTLEKICEIFNCDISHIIVIKNKKREK